MTEEDWTSSKDSRTMLTFLQGKASLRIARLLRVAAARTRWAEIAPVEQFRLAIEAGEKYADGELSDAELEAHTKGIYGIFATGNQHVHMNPVLMTTSMMTLSAVQNNRNLLSNTGAAWSFASRHVGDKFPTILHCLFGNPFRPVAFDPNWRTATSVGLARTMYDARNFNAMPILADALRDAGCEDAAILGHCRDANGVHVRGCWVVDLVLGKS